VLDQLPPLETWEIPWALFLDLDGTLLEIADHPDMVEVPASLGALLEELRLGLSNALAIVSGRSLSDLSRILQNDSVDLAGCHGGEWRTGGRVSIIAPPERLHDVERRLLELAAPVRGVFIEMKGHAVALHYRGTAFTPSEAQAIAEEVIADFGTEFRTLAGKSVVEILRRNSGKAAVLEHFLSQPAYRNRKPVFLGDDVTDEEAFALVNRLGGYSIHVGTGASTCAQFRVSSVSDVLAWLSGPVLDQLGRRDKLAALGHPVTHS